MLLFDSANSIYLYPSRELVFTLDESLAFQSSLGPSENPVAISNYSLLDETTSISVPAGLFECRNYQGLTESLETNYPHGIRVNDNHYAEKVGLVLQRTQFYSSSNDLEMRLVAYGSTNL